MKEWFNFLTQQRLAQDPDVLDFSGNHETNYGDVTSVSSEPRRLMLFHETTILI